MRRDHTQQNSLTLYAPPPTGCRLPPAEGRSTKTLLCMARRLRLSHLPRSEFKSRLGRGWVRRGHPTTRSCRLYRRKLNRSCASRDLKSMRLAGAGVGAQCSRKPWQRRRWYAHFSSPDVRRLPRFVRTCITFCCCMQRELFRRAPKKSIDCCTSSLV